MCQEQLAFTNLCGGTCAGPNFAFCFQAPTATHSDSFVVRWRIFRASIKLHTVTRSQALIPQKSPLLTYHAEFLTS